MITIKEVDKIKKEDNELKKVYCKPQIKTLPVQRTLGAGQGSQDSEDFNGS